MKLFFIATAVVLISSFLDNTFTTGQLLNSLPAVPPPTPKYIRPHCPKRCVCRDRTAYCDSMMLTSLPRFRNTVIGRSGNTYDTIYLRDNFITRLSNTRLRGYSQTRHLLLKGNKINHIEGYAFGGMHRLTSLSLTENNLTNINKNAFSGMALLQVFSLRDNAIENIEGRFSMLHNLQLLNLANNRIDRITDKTFRGNPLLKVLDMHNNEIRHIDKLAFRPLPFLKFLVLRDNPLGQIEFDFHGNFHIELLDLTNCQLSEMVKGLPHSVHDLRLAENNITELLPEHFKTIKKIRMLVLNNNQISYIAPDTLKNLWELWDFYVGDNRIYEIPANIPKNLRGFYANRNNITHLATAMFPHHSRLENLYLKNNHINGVEREALQDLKHLRSLDLSRNELQNVAPYTFTNLSRLEVLDLSSNPIRALPRKSFHGLKRLHILQLNSIGSKGSASSVQPSIFEDMDRLLFLDMSNSSALAQKMAENPSTLNYLHSVQDLNMMEDDLKSLPPNFPLFFPNLKMVKLVGNPWHCDGNIWWMAEWLRSNKIKFFAPERMQCETPKKLNGKPLSNLRPEDLFTEEEMEAMGITLTPPTRTRRPRPTKPMEVFTRETQKANVTKFGKNFTVKVEVHTHSTDFGSVPTEEMPVVRTQRQRTTTEVPTTTTTEAMTTTTTTTTTTRPTTTTTEPTTTTKPTTTTTTTTPKPTTTATKPTPRPTTTTTTTTTKPTTTTRKPTTTTMTTPEPTTTPTTTTTTTTTTTQPTTTETPKPTNNTLNNNMTRYKPPRKGPLPSRFAPKYPTKDEKKKGEYDDFYHAKERLNQHHRSVIFGNKKLKAIKESSYAGLGGSQDSDVNNVLYGTDNDDDDGDDGDGSVANSNEIDSDGTVTSSSSVDYSAEETRSNSLQKSRVFQHKNVAAESDDEDVAGSSGRGPPAATKKTPKKKKWKPTKENIPKETNNSLPPLPTQGINVAIRVNSARNRVKATSIQNSIDRPVATQGNDDVQSKKPASVKPVSVPMQKVSTASEQDNSVSDRVNSGKSISSGEMGDENENYDDEIEVGDTSEEEELLDEGNMLLF